MEAEQRKERFIALLETLLNENGGVKAKLAEKLQINSSTLSRWFLKQVDPATLNFKNFIKLSEIANLSTDDLAKKIGILPQAEEDVLDKFQILIKDLLSNQSLEQLGNKLGVTHGAIGGWLSSKRKINPQKLDVGTMIAIATEKGWTIETLLIYLGLKNLEFQENLEIQVESIANNLSLNQQVNLLISLCEILRDKIEKKQKITPKLFSNNDFSICIIISSKDLEIASRYTADLIIYLQVFPDNIKITTFSTLFESLENFDLLIFDIDTNASAAIDRINKISFDGDIVIFASPELEEEVRSQLEDKVTDIVVKPIDWESLKDKPYFTST